MWWWALAAALVLFGSVLAAAEASLTRTSRVRALALEEEGRRNAETLVKIESDPPRYLNAVYLTVMFVQNGSAILVAFLAERQFGDTWVTFGSFLFTILYFVFVEAMAKTFAVLHADRVALALSPIVWFLGRVLAVPTRFLIGLSNLLLPGKGLKQGPFVSEEEIRSMAEVGSEEGSIDEGEKELIHSIFEFGDTIVREVMVPRPDIVAIEDDKTLRDVQALVLSYGYSRVPVFHESLDDVKGVVFAKDVLKALHQGRQDMPLSEIMRPAHFVPETKRVGEFPTER
jgi:CBS domain containing-hemolysin-like protein